MKRQQKYFNLETYDYTPYARELTEEEMYLVNGGRRMIGDRTNESEHVSSQPSSSSESGSSSGTSTTSNSTSNSVPAATQTTTSSSQTNSSSQQNNTESQPQTSSAATCTAAQIAAAKGAAANAYFAEQDKKREENNRQNSNSGSSSSSSSSSSALSHQEQYEMAKKDYDEHYGKNSSESFDDFSAEGSSVNGNSVIEKSDIENEIDNNTVSNTSMTTSQQGIDFITIYEKFKGKIYDANDINHEYKPGETVETGDWTIGFGHKLTSIELSQGIFDNGIEEEDAKVLRAKDLYNIEEGINKNFTGSSLTQNQFDALVSLGINLGRQGLIDSIPFSNAEDNITDEQTILQGFTAYKYSKGQYVSGLEMRRYDEVEIYLYGEYDRNDDFTLDKPNN